MVEQGVRAARAVKCYKIRQPNSVSRILSKLQNPYLEVAGRSEPFLTVSEVTTEGFLIGVYEHVLLQITALIECFRTVVTLKRLLTCNILALKSQK